MRSQGISKCKQVDGLALSPQTINLHWSAIKTVSSEFGGLVLYLPLLYRGGNHSCIVASYCSDSMQVQSLIYMLKNPLQKRTTRILTNINLSEYRVQETVGKEKVFTASFYLTCWLKGSSASWQRRCIVWLLLHYISESLCKSSMLRSLTRPKVINSPSKKVLPLHIVDSCNGRRSERLCCPCYIDSRPDQFLVTPLSPGPNGFSEALSRFLDGYSCSATLSQREQIPFFSRQVTTTPTDTARASLGIIQHATKKNFAITETAVGVVLSHLLCYTRREVALHPHSSTTGWMGNSPLI